MAVLAHNVLEMVRKLSHSVGPPDLLSPVVDTTANSENSMAVALWHSSTSPRNFPKQTQLTKTSGLASAGPTAALEGLLQRALFSAVYAQLQLKGRIPYSDSVQRFQAMRFPSGTGEWRRNKTG